MSSAAAVMANHPIGNDRQQDSHPDYSAVRAIAEWRIDCTTRAGTFAARVLLIAAVVAAYPFEVCSITIKYFIASVLPALQNTVQRSWRKVVARLPSDYASVFDRSESRAS